MGLYSYAMKRGPLFIGLAAFAAIAALVAWPAIRIARSLESGRASAEAAFDELRRNALNQLAGPESLAQAAWKDGAAGFWKSEPSALAVLVKDRDGTVVYAMPSASPYYRRVPGGLEFEMPDRTALAFSGPLSAGLSIDALFVTLSQEALYLPFRDALIAALALLGVSAGALAAVSARRAPLARAVPEEAQAAEATPSRIDETSLYAEESYQHGHPTAEAPRQADIATAPDAPEPLDSKGVGVVRPSDLPAGALDGPRGLFDPESGLGWEAYLRDRLGAELRRSASFEQDLSLLLCELDGTVRGDEDFNLFAASVRDYFGFKDMAFLFREGGVMCVLPNVDVDHALRMSGELRKKLHYMFQGKGDSGIRIGLTSRAGRLVDADRLIGEAMAAIGKAKSEGATSIMAFRPDPEKFRAYLAGQ